MSIYIPAATRALDVWRSIEGKPSEVVFVKPGALTKSGSTPAVTLPAQTVRIENDNRATIVQGMAGVAPKRNAVVFGVRDHPTIADCDMNEGYTFDHEGDHYRCTDVIVSPGQVKGIFVVNG